MTRYRVSGPFTKARRRLACALAALALVAACDDDPTQASIPDLSGDFTVTPDTIGVQEAIRVVFNRPIDEATALDPANFVVTNLCDTLRIPGAVRLVGDTLIFSPSEAQPFLTLISVRIQNILDEQGNGLREPIVFQLITQRPPVSDVSWSFLNSPTNDQVTGIDFATPDVGYMGTFGGAVYQTLNGGTTFGARFKNPNITDTYGIQTFGADTVVMVGAILIGGSPRWTAFRSLDSARTFQPGNTVNNLLYASEFRRAGSDVLGVARGIGFLSVAYRYRLSTNTLTQATGLPSSGTELLTDITLSPDTNSAVAVFLDFFTNAGLASRSVNGGASYTTVTLPADTRALFGTGFIDNATALLLGDSSEVMRLDIASGTVTRLGAAQGIPQTEIVGNASTVYTFTRARFVSDGQLGWIVGYETLRRPGTHDELRGVVLQSRDGGQTWSRQAIAGAPENGLSFPPVLAIQPLTRDFAVLSGANGLVAARVDDSQPTAAACSFTQP